jgi:hypothetical protein
MIRRNSKLALRCAAVAMAAGWLGVQSLGSVAYAATLSPQQISQFLANPGAALTQNPNGGAQLVSYVRDLVLADPATLNVLMTLLTNANAAQQSAIGTGLGQAAQALVRTSPDLANQIQTALAASGVQTAIAAYSVVTGNVAIAATGGGAGGGGGGVGGPVGNGPPTGGGGGGGGGLQSNQGSQNSGFTGGGGGGGVGSQGNQNQQGQNSGGSTSPH